MAMKCELEKRIEMTEEVGIYRETALQNALKVYEKNKSFNLNRSKREQVARERQRDSYQRLTSVDLDTLQHLGWKSSCSRFDKNYLPTSTYRRKSGARD
jgi:hypothetical protein